MKLAVLTGDLVRSTELSRGRLELAMQTLTKAATEADTWHGAPLMFSRNRGDGWQVCLARPALALRTALYLRAALRNSGKDLSTRIAIAVGTGDPGDAGDLNAASGQAFIDSGRALDGLQAPAMMVFADGGAMGAVVRLADCLFQGWTQAQARAVRPMLAPGTLTRREVASATGVTRQAVDQALEAANYPALAEALALVEGAQ